MLKYPRRKKHGRSSPLRGVRLPRKQRFQTEIETLSGVKVRSQIERECADFLYQHNIEFHYEPLMLLGGQSYRPDFYLPAYNLFLEICGYTHMPFYRDRVKLKKTVYARHGLKAVFIESAKGKAVLEKLKQTLTELGIEFAE